MIPTLREWKPDPALPDFEITTLGLPADDDGPLVATLVRRAGAHTAAPVSATVAAEQPRRAVLYLHGFIDYFFHAHVAEAFAARGWELYALELRRYGRSLRGGNRPNYCTDLAEYDLEITAAIDILRDDEGYAQVVLLGHSTGGLIASLYAHQGTRREAVGALVLNSPFFAFAVPSPRRYLLPIVDRLGAFLPWGVDPAGLPPSYAESLLAAHHGEWAYDTRWKPVRGFPVYFGWVRAIRAAQARVARGLDLHCPVLVLHAARSMRGGGAWNDAFLTHDIVLDVEDMRRIGPRLGRDVTVHAVRDGMHDLFLARRDVRDHAIAVTLDWCDANADAATRDHDTKGRAHGGAGAAASTGTTWSGT